MTRKRETKYRRNPLNVNISPKPSDLEENVDKYLGGIQKSVGVGLKIKNDKGNDIPIRIVDGAIQFYQNGKWNDTAKSETVINNTQASSSSSSSSSSSNSNSSSITENNILVRKISDLIYRYFKNNFVAGNFANIAYDEDTKKYTITTTYSAGSNIAISNTGVISSTGGGTYTGDDITIQISQDHIISSLQEGLPEHSIEEDGYILQNVNDVPTWVQMQIGNRATTGWVDCALTKYGLSRFEIDSTGYIAKSTDGYAHTINVYPFSRGTETVGPFNANYYNSYDGYFITYFEKSYGFKINDTTNPYNPDIQAFNYIDVDLSVPTGWTHQSGDELMIRVAVNHYTDDDNQSWYSVRVYKKYSRG